MTATDQIRERLREHREGCELCLALEFCAVHEGLEATLARALEDEKVQTDLRGDGAMTRQKRYQMARMAEGKCAQCGKPRQHYATRCDECAIKRRQWQRARLNHRAHAVTGLGRKPFVEDAKR